METGSITVPLAFLAGTLSFISPCVLPLVPVYLGYLSGSSVTDEAEADRWHIFSHALCFVGGFTLIFTLLFGLPATLIGGALSQYNRVIAQVGGVLVILFGLHTIGILHIPFLNMTRRVDVDHGSTPGYIRSTLIGMAFAAGWTPCIGPLLGAVMTMALSDPSQGVFFTLVYAAGLALPFLLTAILLTRATNFRLAACVADAALQAVAQAVLIPQQRQERIHQPPGVAPDARTLQGCGRVINGYAHPAHSMPRYVQMRLTPKFQKSTTPMAKALARL